MMQELMLYSNTIERQDTFGLYTQSQYRDFHKEVNVVYGGGLKLQKVEYTLNHLVHQEDRVVNMNGRKYLQEIVDEEKRLEKNAVDMNPNVLSGMPVIQGTRIQVSLLLACLRDGMTIEEICEDYSLQPRIVKQGLDFAIKVLDYPFDEE